MKKPLMILFAAFGLAGLSGCSEMQKQYRDMYCNYDGAYKKGANDFEEKGRMDPQATAPCTLEERKEADRGYREGFAMARGSSPITINIGQGNPGTPRTCLQAYGKEKCGYDCKQSYGKIACGKNPGDNCVVAYGQIRCGQNCRDSYGHIECD